MIRARLRMYGSRVVVILSGPSHVALAGVPRHGCECVPDVHGDEVLVRGVSDLTRWVAVHLLHDAPEAFGPLDR